MKTFLVSILFSLFLFNFSQAQSGNNFGLKLGLSTDNLNGETIQNDGLSLAIKDASYGFHIGAFARVRLGEKFHIQPEVLFNSETVDYTLNDVSQNVINKIVSETYQNLDFPLLAGWQFGFLRLNAGPVGHVHVASKSDIGSNVPTYTQRFENFTLGYQAGAGLDIWRLVVDVRFEGNLSRLGDHMYFAGEKVNFSQRPSRWILSVGYAF